MVLSSPFAVVKKRGKERTLDVDESPPKLLTVLRSPLM